MSDYSSVAGKPYKKNKYKNYLRLLWLFLIWPAYKAVQAFDNSLIGESLVYFLLFLILLGFLIFATYKYTKAPIDF